MHHWFIISFTRQKFGLLREKHYWNFIQSSTMLTIKRAFGILKGRWRILLKYIDLPFENVCDLVTTCIYLDNLCLIHGDGFDMQWAKEAEQEMQNFQNESFGNLENIDMFHIVEVSIQQMKALQHSKIGIEYIEDEEVEIDFN